ncbi:dipeptidase [Dyadobacter chenwenxiniae]|uniref:Dipeptidase n=1 Tax=Dyadobacter chenwenxiniae TaxID=2906456 RepID=A0A9X1TPG6_9BACT|nr:dipeptidase [Dyadobacter chenwenxiniae]MCF0065518.1 dipeptidase [Dyadobacter chenwenxiniae]UON82075.1 dipeptidase [Dyadobacter chenwenxiniae]
MLSYINENRDRFLNELLDLLRIPSVSADSKFKPEMRKAAEFVRDRISEAGADRVEIYETAGHPVVYGQKIVDENLPTVLIYGHYDVQPADPYELWNSPPFEPVIKNERIYARGSCDDKGQFYMHIKALETMLATGNLTCNVKIMIEGEEEIGSSNLGSFVSAHKEMLKCDTILISDTSIIANDVPSIETGLRGLTYVEVEVIGANRDLHSGVYGGGVANPINVLCEMIASLKDEKGHITIPGFYDDVEDLTADQRAALNAAPFDLEEYKKDLQIDDIMGEEGYSTIERTSVRPTLDVNGIWGGYIGEGAKTVLPSKANAKISMRLVPHQTDEEILELFTRHFESIAPAAVKVKVAPHHGGLPYVTPTDSVEYKAAEMAMEESFGKKPIPTRGGGSIPIVALFEQELGCKSILMGFGLDIDALHSPNESYGLFNYYKGIETIPLFFKHYAALKNPAKA